MQSEELTVPKKPKRRAFSMLVEGLVSAESQGDDITTWVLTSD
jgi:hypothetical protein